MEVEIVTTKLKMRRTMMYIMRLIKYLIETKGPIDSSKVREVMTE